MKITPSSLVLYIAVASVPFDFAVTLGVVRATPTELLFSLAMVLWLWRSGRASKPMEFAPYFMPLLFFLGACLLSLLAAQNRFVALRETVQFAWLFGLFYFVAHEIREPRETLTLWSLLLVAGLVVAGVGIYQYFLVREPIHFLIAETRLRAHGVHDQPNSFGNYLIGVIPLLFGFYFLADTLAPSVHERRGWVGKIFLNKRVIVALLFILSTALVATFSRGSWVGLGFGAVTLYFLLKGKIRHASLVLLPGVIGIAATLVIGDLSRQPRHTGRSFSNKQRAELLKAAIQMARDHPWLGIGFGNFPDRLPEYTSPELMQMMKLDYDPIKKEWFLNPNKKPDIEIVHNTLVQVAAETGLFGMAAFVWLFVVYYRRALKLLREAVEQKEYCIRATALAGATAILCSGMFGWPFSHGVQEVLIVTMAIAVANERSLSSMKNTLGVT